MKNHKVKRSLAPGFSAPDVSTGPYAPPEEILAIPIWRPFEDKPIDECIAKEIVDHKRDSDHPSKNKCNQPDDQKPKCCYVHKTLMPTSNDGINQQDI